GATALALLAQVAEPWNLSDPQTETLLEWAARLHEIGLDVSHSQYQKHGAYLLEHADMPGFTREEQRVLSYVVCRHRRKLPVTDAQQLIPPWDVQAEPLVLVLRLAVLLHRGRSSVQLPVIKLAARGRSLTMNFPRGWLKDHALTVADLRQEVEYWKAANLRLRVFDTYSA
ncbi:MAG TPA: exopolyphosphatase, partial [Steroidobacteraceae bacterium]|nr:exopolyphosphatase [Steroidobacteraceae bacterium]